MTEKRFVPRMLTLSGLVLSMLLFMASLPDRVRADAFIDLAIDPSSQVVALGDAADFTLTAANINSVPLTNVTIDHGNVCDSLTGPTGDGGTIGVLDVGETWTYNCTAENVLSSFTLQATVNGQRGDDSTPVSHTDTATVALAAPNIAVEKTPATQNTSGGSVNFTITVDNTGNVGLNNIIVNDPTCDSLTGPSGDTNGNNVLEPSENWTYTCTVNNVQDGFINSVTVTGTPPVGPNLTDSDAAQVLLTEAVNACPANMTAYWKLDETGGPSYDDYYSGHDGVCADACPAVSTDGRVGNAQTFVGTSTGIDIPVIPGDSSFNWSQNANFSIELWLKTSPGSCTGPENEVAIGRNEDDYPTTNLHWWLGCETVTGQARFRLGDTTGDFVDLKGYGPAINDGNWHHLVGVRNGSTKVNYLYVDGVEVFSAAKTYAAGFDSATAPLNIGYLFLRGSRFHFQGELDELAVYNKALSAGEIADHYNNGDPRRGYCGAPVIVSTPVTTAQVGETYTYTVQALGNSTLTYALTIGLTGMTINSTTGEITWIPAAGQEGLHNVQVEARNSAGEDTQDFMIGVGFYYNYLPIVVK
jgi:uncharacterized repeat protein (TIGR01451 family)